MTCGHEGCARPGDGRAAAARGKTSSKMLERHPTHRRETVRQARMRRSPDVTTTLLLIVALASGECGRIRSPT